MKVCKGRARCSLQIWRDTSRPVCCSGRNKRDEQIRQCDLYTQTYPPETVAIEARRARKAGENA